MGSGLQAARRLPVRHQPKAAPSILAAGAAICSRSTRHYFEERGYRPTSQGWAAPNLRPRRASWGRRWRPFSPWRSSGAQRPKA